MPVATLERTNLAKGGEPVKNVLVPDESSKMYKGAKNAGIKLDGPYYAILVKGDDDEPGACASVHEKLQEVLELKGSKQTLGHELANIISVEFNRRKDLQ